MLCMKDSVPLNASQYVGKKARTLNPSNRMRLASVTKSQLICLRSALDAGGGFVRVFVLVAVVVICWWGGGGRVEVLLY